MVKTLAPECGKELHNSKEKIGEELMWPRGNMVRIWWTEKLTNDSILKGVGTHPHAVSEFGNYLTHTVRQLEDNLSSVSGQYQRSFTGVFEGHRSRKIHNFLLRRLMDGT